MLCKCHWIVLYTVHFTAFCLGGRFFPDTDTGWIYLSSPQPWLLLRDVGHEVIVTVYVVWIPGSGALQLVSKLPGRSLLCFQLPGLEVPWRGRRLPLLSPSLPRLYGSQWWAGAGRLSGLLQPAARRRLGVKNLLEWDDYRVSRGVLFLPCTSERFHLREIGKLCAV